MGAENGISGAVFTPTEKPHRFLSIIKSKFAVLALEPNIALTLGFMSINF